jgi:hypothetical protein
MSRQGDSSRFARMDEALARLIDGRVLDSRGEPREDRAADEALVSAVATQLRNMQAFRRRLKLAAWHVGRGKNAKLKADLLRRLHNGEMVEVLRLAAVIHLRTHLYGPEA